MTTNYEVDNMEDETYSGELEIILYNLIYDLEVEDCMDCIQELNEKYARNPKLDMYKGVFYTSLISVLLFILIIGFILAGGV